MPMMPVDDREQNIVPLTPRSLRAVATGPDPARAATARYLKQAVNSEAQRWTWGRVAGGVLASLLIVAVLTFLSLFRVLRGSSVLVAFIAMVLGVHLLFRWLAGRQISGELATTAVASGLCGQCGYTLADLDPQPDGCVVCPECGAAWRAIRIIAPHWLHEDPRLVRRPRRSSWWVRFLYLVPKDSARLGPDDRGRIVPILDSRLRALDPSIRGAVPAPELRRLVRVLRRSGAVGRIIMALPCLGLAALCAFGSLAAATHRYPEPVAAISLGVGALVFVSAGVMMILGHSFYNPRRAARLFANRARCARCATDLRGLPPGPDGLVECPMCAAAWRVPTGALATEPGVPVSVAAAAAPAAPPPQASPPRPEPAP